MVSSPRVATFPGGNSSGWREVLAEGVLETWCHLRMMGETPMDRSRL